MSIALEDKVVFIPANISRKEDLFDLLSVELKFPSYFGKNWDALYDCLSDLHWIENKKTWIIHNDIPLKCSGSDFDKYVEILFDLTADPDIDKTHLLEIAFPQEYRIDIENLLKKQKLKKQ